MEWMKEITIQDMPNGDMRLVAELCGVEIAVKLMEQLGGVNIYIPKLLEKRLMEAYVQRHYTGSNAKELAIKMGKSVRFVYGLVESNRASKNGGAQTDLFDSANNDTPKTTKGEKRG